MGDDVDWSSGGKTDDRIELGLTTTTDNTTAELTDWQRAEQMSDCCCVMWSGLN